MHEPNLEQIKKNYHGKLRSYLEGFFGSILLTLLSFGLVVFHILPPLPLAAAITTLALVQAAVQLHFFMKLGYEDKPKWETLTFSFMFLILLIIAIGSLWIMFDLDMRLMQM